MRVTLLLIVALQAISNAQATDSIPVDSRLPEPFVLLHARGQVVQDDIRSVRGRFRETTDSPLFSYARVAEGNLVASHPNHLRLDYDCPDERTLLVVGDILQLIDHSTGTRETLDISRAQDNVERFFVNADAKRLQQMFSIEVFEDFLVPGTFRVDMRPTEGRIRKGLDFLQLWLDQETLLMVRMRMILPGGGTKLIELLQLDDNVPVAESIFSAATSPGAAALLERAKPAKPAEIVTPRDDFRK